MADAGYTFLPWCRQGIVAELDAPDSGQPLDPRAVVRVGVTITNAGTGGIDVTVLGPGDVTGIDPRLVVRTEPRPGTTAFEPNQIAAVDFDLPDLPWLVTPASPGGATLRPWIALVVVEQQDGVSVALEPGALLPVLRIAAPADALVELPDPASTSLWAHAQVLADAGIASAALPAELASRPAANVSRLVCPRRLRAGARYFACVVPTFDAGAVRGLGGIPVEDAALQPSWGDARTVRLPVYHHWEFATGPDGDFETLAARLRPHRSTTRVGRVPMHVGDAQTGVVELLDGDPGAVVDMDGALRAPSGDELRVEDVDRRVRDGLRDAVDTAARTAGGASTVVAVGPPLYGSWHANRHRLAGDAPEWLAELNTDPRARVAAGLGAEAVRRNQEELMHGAWVQLGDIRQANDRLNAGRLSLEVARKVHARHLASLPAARLVPLTSPVHRRTPVASPSGRTSLPEAMTPTSLPAAAFGAAMRRFASPRRALPRAAARRAWRAFTPAVAALLARGFDGVDPNRFVPDGIVAMASLDALGLPTAPDAAVDLSPIGVVGTLPAHRLRAQRDLARRLASMAEARVDVRARSNVPAAGLVTGEQVQTIESMADLDGDERAHALRQLAVTAAAKPRAAAYLATLRDGALTALDALDVAPDGAVSIRTAPHVPNTVIGRIEPSLAQRPGGLAGVLTGLPPGTIDRTGTGRPFVVRPAAGGGIVVDRPRTGRAGVEAATAERPAAERPTVGRPPVAVPSGGRPSVGRPSVGRPPTAPPSHVLPAPVTDAATADRFRGAFTALRDRLRLDATPVRPVLVPFDLGDAARAVLRRTEPDRTVPARLAAIVRIGGHDFRRRAPGVSVAPNEDRIMAYPTFDVPSYLYLARYDRTRFCPGIDEIPTDSVTLLETNPRFVEAFLVGLNHEMNHELLWRTYPTDQRGTPFRRFWDRVDGQPDVGPVHEFAPGRLGSHLVDAEPKLVLLLRGELLRRYATAAVYAVRATAQGRLSTAAADTLTPIFTGSFEPDVTFVGFDLEDRQLDDGNGWFFVVQEQPTEPRFGLDDPPSRTAARPASWQEAAWSDTGVAPGGHLDPSALAAVGFGPVPHAGAAAAALFQRPMRVAIHARHLVTREP